MVICKQVFTIAVAMMIYLHTANTLRGIQVLLTVKTCKGVCLFVWLVALRPKSTAMVIAGRSVHLTTLFPGQA